ncbi:hypothetical protein SASPL_102656 [Salvia splendens]|uniref:Uncharacterized protein n=1 Tax=Salvia splendens TaxID=180675 RepID=A0A8X8YRM7_SALSN|nr:hypothetical protein SASPL_102656 [Salvia splendens]
MSGAEESKEQREVVMEDGEKAMPSPQQEVEESVKNKYGGLMPKKQPLISKDHERAYFDSADWALGKVDRSLKDHWRLSGPSYSQLNSKQATANLLVHRQKVKIEALPKKKMRLTMNKKLLSILGKLSDIVCIVDIEIWNNAAFDHDEISEDLAANKQPWGSLKPNFGNPNSSFDSVPDKENQGFASENQNQFHHVSPFPRLASKTPFKPLTTVESIQRLKLRANADKGFEKNPVLKIDEEIEEIELQITRLNSRLEALKA